LIGELVLGNELMWSADQQNPKSATRNAIQYTVDRSLAILDKLGVIGHRAGVDSNPALPAVPHVVGYRMFDAWIVNIDRHHENRGVGQRGLIGIATRVIELADRRIDR
jgi:hypothetical protein